LQEQAKLSNVRCSSHWGGSPQNRLGDEQTCGMTLASAYVLYHLLGDEQTCGMTLASTYVLYHLSAA